MKENNTHKQRERNLEELEELRQQVRDWNQISSHEAQMEWAEEALFARWDWELAAKTNGDPEMTEYLAQLHSEFSCMIPEDLWLELFPLEAS